LYIVIGVAPSVIIFEMVSYISSNSLCHRTQSDCVYAEILH